MRALGPNDGLVLLEDELIPGGAPLLAVGVDHFLVHPDRNLWTAALLRVVVKGLASPDSNEHRIGKREEISRQDRKAPRRKSKESAKGAK
jgi:hypothetical protein